MGVKPTKKNQESDSLQEQIIKLEKQLETFKHSNDHFLKNKLFLHYDIKEPEKVVVDCETKLPVLAEINNKKILKGKESDPTHLLIEGDNYHALSVLNYTHAGKIDLIYIDPPYNTGNKDFIYNDRFVDREDSFRHSKWLSFMAHRLRLAKNLLAEAGVIFISIDDNEQAHLRLLCDQIFGEENFVNTIIWQKKYRPQNDAKHFSSNHDFILVYAKNKEVWRPNLLPRTDTMDAGYKNPDSDPKGPWGSSGLMIEGVTKNGVYEIISPTGKKFLPTKGKRWSLAKQNFQKALMEGKIWFGKDGNAAPRVKRYLSEVKEGLTPQTIWKFEDVGHTGTGVKDLENLGMKDNFSNPKPISLIEQVLRIATNNSATVLDFFAGSGTTGHAVLKQNAQDGGTRQFILCSTNDEKEPIVDKVTYPRIKKVIAGYGDHEAIPANLRYFQTGFVMKKGGSSQLKIDLTRQCAEMLCVKENVFEAVKLRKQAKNYKLFRNGDKYLGVFFDFFTDAEFTGFIKELNALPKEAEKVVYVFVLDGSASILADEFVSVPNCEVKEIPQKILDIYKQLTREVARK